MTEKIKSEGECHFCGKTFTKAGINRHLQKHLADKATQNKPGKSFLLKIEISARWGSGPYFLSLWVDGEIEVKDIDDFLRAIWLDCCGHASSFANPKNKREHGGMWDYFDAEELLESGKIKEYEKRMEELTGRIPMEEKAKSIFHKGLKLEYQYDYGSTTELDVGVVDEYPSKADKAIVLLSRNEPLELLCDTCQEKPAIRICNVHDWGEDSRFCAKCAKRHAKTCEDFADYASMPVVNSPRTGVCGYMGGRVDTERDGVFVKNG